MPGFLFPRYKRTADLSILGLGEVEILSMDHRQSSNVTELPVESGAVISDHIQDLPDRVAVRGMLGSLFTIRSGERYNKLNQVPTAWQTLRELRTTGTLLTFTSDLQVYDNMAIVSIRAPRNVRTGRTLVFELELKEIKLSQVQVQAIDPGSGDPNVDTDNPVKDRPAEDMNRGGIGIVMFEGDLPDPTGEDHTGRGGGGFGFHERRFDGGDDDELDQG